ncbi:Det1 complexing ubiquitin ligase [Zea mays]|uniref:Det1 complexing ubiquitin ligase n=1 Tax=Zea mays TaxID=4577 RepID=A0A1D6JM67_MAIZE|nr:Det1 complexing ubiquitin ligase [Zea mays]
MYVWYDQES